MQKNIKCYFVFLLLFFSSKIYCQSSLPQIHITNGSLKVSMIRFNIITDSICNKLTADSLTADDCICFARVSNTMLYHNMFHKDTVLNLADNCLAALREKFDLILNKLEAVPHGRYGHYYSKKYDIYLPCMCYGDVLKNNIYDIVDY